MLLYFRISEDALATVFQDSKHHHPRETGGILIGRHDGDTVTIEFASGSGPNAIHRRSRFVRDGIYCQEVLDEVVRSTNRLWEYIGEWHSHPTNQGLSKKDKVSMQEIQLDVEYAIPNPILGLCIWYAPNNLRFECYLLLEGAPYLLKQR